MALDALLGAGEVHRDLRLQDQPVGAPAGSGFLRLANCSRACEQTAKEFGEDGAA
jgi:hypothetical protein